VLPSKEADMPKKYRVTLTPEERVELERMIRSGRAAARKLTHARVLLKADEGGGGELGAKRGHWVGSPTERV
jgi:hypothetical protein